MREWLDAHGVVELALTVAAALLFPTALGLAVDLAFGTAPWALLAGALVGNALATFGLTRVVSRRYDRLAPSSRNKDSALQQTTPRRPGDAQPPSEAQTRPTAADVESEPRRGPEHHREQEQR